MLSIHIPFNNLVLLPFSSPIISAVEIVRSPTQCRNKVLSLRLEGKDIGFVPTMGALHEGHLELVNSARLSCDFVIVSIFVNPTQFNSSEDFKKYPNSFDADLEMLRHIGCDMVFAPAEKDIYPSRPEIKISFPNLQYQMEGSFRPGHFEGVSLVVSKLLHLVPAQKVFFGQKDWQQVVIIRQLVKDLLFATEILTVPTVREEDGLAMSSRNQRLSFKQREVAAVFNRSLRLAKEKLLAGSTVEEAKLVVREEFEGSQDVSLEYFEVANRETLEVLRSVDTSIPVSLFIAGYVGQVRLIDNIFLKEETY